VTRALVLAAALGWSAGLARADEPPAPAPPSDAETPSAADAHVAAARALHAKGDFEGARTEILAAYQLEPRPAFLFALGQIEFNLHHYEDAIDYYERFAATQPSAEQAELAVQAIVAARAELSRPPPKPPAPPPPPPPTPHRAWDGVDLSVVAFGGLAVAAGGGLLYEALHLASHAGCGTISEYDRNLLTARRVRLGAGASAAAGALAIGAGLLRWRFHLVDTTIEVRASPAGAGVVLEHAL